MSTHVPGPAKPQTQNHLDANRVSHEAGASEGGVDNVTEVEEIAKQAEELTKQMEARVGMEGEGARRFAVHKAPAKPTREEIDEHMVIHAPPKLWYKHCVRATTGRDPRRRGQVELPDAEVSLDKVPTIFVDLLYLHKRELNPNLVKVTTESGQEAATAVALQAEIQRLRTAKTMPINSVVGWSEANGLVENTTKPAQDKVRALNCTI